MKKTTAALTLAAAMLPFVMAPSTARADTIVTQSPPSGVLSLSAQASEDIPQDVVEITLFYEQQAQDAASLTDALNKHADAALRQAKGTADVTARTGAFSIYPTTDRDGRISAWRGRTEIVLKSHDFDAATKLASALNSTMQVASVSFSLSPEAERKAQEKLMGDAIASFREQADASAHAFGYTGFTIRDVNVGHIGVTPPRPMFAMRAMAAGQGEPANAPLEVQGGTATVTVNVTGSVQMTR
jgi:predicted secreted protein